MLIGIVGGWGKTTLAMYLVRVHRFVARNKLPQKPLSPGQRVVVDPGGPGMTTRQQAVFARRVHRLGGIVVRLDGEAAVPIVVLPNPRSKDGKSEVLFTAVDGLLGYGTRAVPSCSGHLRGCI